MEGISEKVKVEHFQMKMNEHLLYHDMEKDKKKKERLLNFQQKIKFSVKTRLDTRLPYLRAWGKGAVFEVNSKTRAGQEQRG